jgi:hypothetical protein
MNATTILKVTDLTEPNRCTVIGTHVARNAKTMKPQLQQNKLQFERTRERKWYSIAV